MAASIENFHRSRITALTAAGLMLALSLADESKIKEAKIFEVSVSFASKDFTLICLFIASSVSLIAMWLSWINDAKAIHDVRYRGLEALQVPNEIATEVKKAVMQISHMEQAISTLMTLPDLAEEAQSKAIGVDSYEIIQAFRSIWTEDDAANLFTELQEAARQVGPGYYSGNPVHQPAVEYLHSIVLPRHENILDKKSNELIIRGTAISEIRKGIPAIKRGLQDQSMQLTALNGELSRYNSFVRSSKLTISLESFYIGLIAPTVLYGIGLLHAVGALGVKWWISAPEGVEVVLKFLRNHL